MNEIHEVQAGPVVKVARDLTEIVAMCAHLDEQAEHKANATMDGTGLPGGLAMVALAPVANIEAWNNLEDAAERTGKPYVSVEDEDGDWEPPLQTLVFWSEDWRREHEQEWDGRRPTVASEANFIRWALDWAWDNEPRWDDFAADVRRARVRIENVLYAGNRAERTRIVCSECDKAPRLIRKYGNEVDGADDWWLCPSCKHRYDADGIGRAHAKMLRSDGAAKWVQQADAIGTLRAQGRAEQLVRRWLAQGEGEAYCDPVTHEVWIWWPDLWRKHLSTPTRNRNAG